MYIFVYTYKWLQDLKIDPKSLEEETVAHSSILAWEIPRREETGRLSSTGPPRVGLDGVSEHRDSLPAWLVGFQSQTRDRTDRQWKHWARTSWTTREFPRFCFHLPFPASWILQISLFRCSHLTLQTAQGFPISLWSFAPSPPFFIPLNFLKMCLAINPRLHLFTLNVSLNPLQPKFWCHKLLCVRVCV